jgi:hypothetical protein
VSADYLLWWTKDTHFPPLVTASPFGTPRDMTGVLGAPGTVVLSETTADSTERSGARLTAGFWLDPCHHLGLETTLFFLGDRGTGMSADSAMTPLLARPFFDVVRGVETSQLVAYPGLLSGNVGMTTSNSLWGAELNFRRPGVWCGCGWCGWSRNLDLIAGFRYLELRDLLDIGENLNVLSGMPGVAGSTIGVTDSFGTHNDFFGGQLGAQLEFRKANWSFDVLAKVALGATHEVVNINGDTVFTLPGGMVINERGGLLAQGTNIGHYDRNEFSVVPELGLKLGYQLTDRLRLTVGYTALYWSNVVRSGEQIDRGINPTQLPTVFGPGTLVGPARPAFAFKENDYWAHGVTFGVEFRY